MPDERGFSQTDVLTLSLEVAKARIGVLEGLVGMLFAKAGIDKIEGVPLAEFTQAAADALVAEHIETMERIQPDVGKR